MPKKKSGTFDQSKYIQRYMREKVTVKKVLFNNEYDSDLLSWLSSQGSFSTYVKRLIREDMQKT